MNAYLVCLPQESVFKKVVQNTMVRDRQHGPIIEVNRLQVRTMSCKLRTALLIYNLFGVTVV